MFLNTFSILINLIGLASEIELGLFLATILGLVYFSAPANGYSRASRHYKNLYDYLYSAWLGKAELWRVFWPFFVLVNAAFVYIDYRVMAVTYTIASWKTVHGMLFLPIAWWILGVWRCSLNTRHKLWAVLARTATVYLVLELLLRFVISYFYPATLFDCRLLVMEYGDCL